MQKSATTRNLLPIIPKTEDGWPTMTYDRSPKMKSARKHSSQYDLSDPPTAKGDEGFY